MSVSIIRYRDRAEWLDGRKGGIGSSEVATILGVNEYETPYQLWRRKKGLDPEQPENIYMKAGHILEDAVSRYFADETGAEIIKRSADDFIVFNDMRPYLRVSPDRTLWMPGKTHNEANKGILECKTTQLEVSPDDVPQRWFVQLQYQLGAAEKNFGALAWLTRGLEFGYAVYDFDPEFFKWIIEECDRFWTDYIVGDGVPDNMSVEDIAIRYPRSAAGKSVEATEEISDLAVELLEAKAAQKEAETRVDELSAKIKLFMGDAEILTYGGRTLATWKTGKDKEVFDIRAFEAQHGALMTKYMVPVPGNRTFLLKKQK